MCESVTWELLVHGQMRTCLMTLIGTLLCHHLCLTRDGAAKAGTALSHSVVLWRALCWYIDSASLMVHRLRGSWDGPGGQSYRGSWQGC